MAHVELDTSYSVVAGGTRERRKRVLVPTGRPPTMRDKLHDEVRKDDSRAPCNLPLKQAYALRKVLYRLSSIASNYGNFHKKRCGSRLDSRSGPGRRKLARPGGS